MKKLMPFVATVSAASGLLVQKIPHMRLVAQLASGAINGDPVPVTDFVPVRFEEETITYRCRELVFDVPRSATVTPEPTWSDECWAYWVRLDGLTCHVWAPRHQNPNAENWCDTRSCAGAAGDEEIDRQAAICAASWRDFPSGRARPTWRLCRRGWKSGRLSAYPASMWKWFAARACAACCDAPCAKTGRVWCWTIFLLTIDSRGSRYCARRREQIRRCIRGARSSARFAWSLILAARPPGSGVTGRPSWLNPVSPGAHRTSRR